MTNDRYGTITGRGCSLASRLRLLVVPSKPAVAAKYMHPGFAITGPNADIWPLSPKDWLSG